MSAGAAEPWTIARVLAWAADDLRQRAAETPRLDAEVVLAHVLRTTRIALVTDATRPLSAEELARYRELHKRRRAGEPVAYLVGEREFYGRPFRVDRRVLVPRPDTETLVTVALERTAARALHVRALDLCTGSGCVVITLAKERPTSHFLGTDLSEDALAVARDNAARLGALPWLGFQRADLFEGLRVAPLDLITANPPYIPDGDLPGLSVSIRAFEPTMALVGGSDGLAIANRIIAAAPGHLSEGGVLAMEIGAGQASDVKRAFEARGFRDVEARRDYGGIERVVSGVWPG
ncbi:MAG: peptide chain release factor N(5)-glutamine methyltransferase [Polyangiaceae bacterium]